MTPDNENDDITEASFPVNFGDETEVLDQYGVWVKSGPRDASADSLSGPSVARMRIRPSAQAEPDALPDLPDFDAEIDLEPSTVLEGIASADDFVLPDFDEAPTETLDVTDDFSLSEMDDVADAFAAADEPLRASDGFASLADEEPVEIVFEELAPQESEPIFERFETPGESQAPSRSSEAEYNISSFTPDVSETPIIDKEIVFEDITPDSGPSVVEADEVVDLDAIEGLPESIELPAEAGFDVSLDDLVEEKKTDTMPSDEDFSSFLDDLNAGNVEPTATPTPSPGSADDGLDLDSFVNAFNETGGASPEENEKVFDDDEPVDIDLDFDEAFIKDAEKIKATGSTVTESEFFNSEFGVELIDETSASQLDADLDDLVSATSEKPAAGKTERKAREPSPAEASLEATDEFDDFLSSLDTTPSAPTVGGDRTVAQSKPRQAINLTVTEEDQIDIGNTVAETASSEEDLIVSLDGGPTEVRADAAVTTEEIVEIPAKSGYNESITAQEPEPPKGEEIEFEGGEFQLSPEDEISLEFDDVLAVERELQASTDDGGEDSLMQNDKSTELLMRIAEELSSIKLEISTLKGELASAKAGMSESTAAPEQDSSGFFSDDDQDEAIALTGDELNNILITADFTEEKTEEPAAEGSPVEEISLDVPTEEAVEFEIPDTLPESAFEAVSVPDFNAEAISVAHINKADDDTSYLEGADGEATIDDVAIEEPELETIDFDEEKLEEPKLDEFNIDLSGVEDDFSAPVADAPFAAIEPETIEVAEEAAAPAVFAPAEEIPDAPATKALPLELKDEIKSVLSYMDQLLESLPEDKIEEFARSEHFEVYKKLFEELGIS